MCTVIVAKDKVHGYPLVVAHARDELVTRASLGPARREDTPDILAPRDLLAGGTWVGVNDAGLIVAITNRLGSRTTDPRPSRGLLALAALQRTSTTTALAALYRHLDNVTYHGFNLLLADRERVHVLSRDTGLAGEDDLEAGVHVITSTDDVDPPTFAPWREHLDHIAMNGSEPFGLHLRTLLRDHAPGQPWGAPICKHRGDYGTVAAAILWVAEDGTVRFEYAAGPPCTTPFVDIETRRRPEQP